MSALALGTANFGLDYGIRNRSGRLARATVEAVLDRAAARGVDTVDTAGAYGDAHDVLRATMRGRFRVVSKCPAGAERDAEAQLRSALVALGVSSLDGWLLHDADAVCDPAVRASLARCRARSRRVGISVYHPRQVRAALDADAPVDLVQLPLNVLDQRFVPLLPELARRGIAVHARSVFLQGTLLAPLNALPAPVEPARTAIERFDALARASGTTREALALAYAASQSVERVVVGVESAAELERDCDALLAASAVSAAALAALAVHDDDVLVPSRWAR